MSQTVCSSCGHKNAVGEIFCLKCGHLLIETTQWNRKPKLTHALPQEPAGLSDIPAPPVISQGTKVFTDHYRLVLHLGDGQRQVMEIADQEEITIGRVDQFTSVLPTINLTNMNAWDRGVSRVHVAIRRRGDALYIYDLESTNGTFLNGQRVLPEAPRLLHNGDRLRLGLFEVDLSFVPETEVDY